MAQIDDDLSVAANGDIRHDSGTTQFTVLEIYRWLQGLSDDPTAAGNDIIDATTKIDVAKRNFDTIIVLNGPYNIDDTLAQFLYAGSITQANGATRYSGLQVKGTVNAGTTELQIIQDDALLTNYWGTGLNQDAANNVLLRILVKTRENGHDIDGRRIRVQAREWGDTFDSFPVTLGVGEETAAISTLADDQNDTLKATVDAYIDITNVEGLQLIDLNNGAGNREYYSKWTFTTNPDGKKALWEWAKAVTVRATAKTIHGRNGELFQGITHHIVYQTEVGGPFQEDEILAWGTTFNYDNEQVGDFAVGETIQFGTSGAIGQLIQLTDAGVTGSMVVAIEPGSGTPEAEEEITGVTSGATADIDGAVSDPAAVGGTGLLLGLDDDGATGNLYIQLLTGVAPVASLGMKGRTSAATADVNGTPTARTVSKVFLGTFPGALTGAYGIGVDADDLLAADKLVDLTGTPQSPPDNQPIDVTGIVSGEDYVILARDDGGGDMDQAEYTLAAGNNTGNGTIVIVEAINAYTPQTGFVRIWNATNGVFDKYAYTSWATSTFTLSGTLSQNYVTSDPVFIPVLDALATATSMSTTAIYGGDILLSGWVKDGGVTPIVPFKIQGTFGAGGFTVKAVRTSDA